MKIGSFSHVRRTPGEVFTTGLAVRRTRKDERVAHWAPNHRSRARTHFVLRLSEVNIRHGRAAGRIAARGVVAVGTSLVRRANLRRLALLDRDFTSDEHP